MEKFAKIWEDTSVPWDVRRGEILELLQREEYGRFLPKPDSVSWETTAQAHGVYGGKAELRHVSITAKWGEKQFTFPIRALLTGDKEKNPFVVYLAFDREWPSRYMDPELFCKRGVSVLYLCYQDITSDDADFTNGLAGVVFGGRERTADDPGKIAMWAWGTQRVLDYGLSLECLDPSKAAVAGHSRLGKTALVAGASDQRFHYVIANNSGAGGTAVFRGKEGETAQDLCNVFGYWFCKGFKKYAGNEAAMPFDQHFLLGAVAPAQLCIGSADEDRWAGPDQEYLSCVLASEVYEKLGLTGLEAPNRPPRIGDNWDRGKIAYHYRAGKHMFSPEDWNIYFDCILNH